MYSEIAGNKRRTVFIMAVFLVFLVLIIWIFNKFLGGSTGVFYGGLVGALFYVVITYYAGAKMALAVNQAHEIKSKRDNPRLWRTIENLAITDGLPMPRVFIMDDPAPNAFATGRDPKHSAVCVTSGLLDIMNDQELEGVLAHEMGHVKNYDIRVAMVAFALTAIISLIADIILRVVWFSNNRQSNNQVFFIMGIVAAILAPFVALLIQMAVSRQREYLADATGALTTRYPEGLASALTKIKKSKRVARHQNTATAHLFFANPLKKSGLTSLFSTHPPLDDRIKRLRGMDTHA